MSAGARRMAAGLVEYRHDIPVGSPLRDVQSREERCRQGPISRQTRKQAGVG